MKKYYKKKQINGKKIKLHRYIMEKHLNRKLNMFEVVHHKDENIFNNNISNLVLTSPEEHPSMHHRHHNHNNMKKRIGISEEKINEIFRLSKNKLNYTEIGKKLNISDMTVGKYLKGFKQKFDTNGRKN
jgi:DNA-binding CsgD family transcriptional regulator